MKTKELIKAVEAISSEYKGVVSEKFGVVLFYRREEVIAIVRLKEIGMVNTIHDMFDLLDDKNRKKILILLTEYALTPLNEREEEKKYYIRLKGICDNVSYVNLRENDNELSMSTIYQPTNYKTQFTKSEIEKYGLEKFADNELFELIEVTDNE